MYKVNEQVYTFFDRAVDGMDFDTVYLVIDENGNEFGKYLWQSVAQKIADQLNGVIVCDICGKAFAPDGCIGETCAECCKPNNKGESYGQAVSKI